MMKIILILAVSAFSCAAFADQRIVPDGMGGYRIQDNRLDMSNWKTGREYDNEQKLMEEKIRYQQLQNEILKRRLEQQQQPSQPMPQSDQLITPEFQDWLSKNVWFGKDRAKTEFALLFAKQLRQDRPDLVGRPFFDAVTAKIEETFGAEK